MASDDEPTTSTGSASAAPITGPAETSSTTSEPSMVNIGIPAKFPTREQLLKFRTMTFMLAKSNPVSPVHGFTFKSDKLDAVLKHSGLPSGSQHELRHLNSFLDALVATLIRDKEIVALSPTGRGPLHLRSEIPIEESSSSQDDGDGDIYYISANPEYEEHGKPPKVTEGEDRPIPALSVQLPVSQPTSGLDDITTAQDVPSFWLRHYTTDKLNGKRQGMRLWEHAENVFAIIKRLFLSPNNGQKSIITALLTRYIYCQSRAKITARIDAGFVHRNFGDNLCMTVETLRGMVHTQLLNEHESVFSGFAASTDETTPIQLLGQPFCIGGDVNPNEELSSLNRILRSDKQASALRSIYRAALAWRQVTPAGTVDMAPSWEESCLYVDAGQEFYNVSGRIEFHRVVSSLMKVIRHFQKTIKDEFTSRAIGTSANELFRTRAKNAHRVPSASRNKKAQNREADLRHKETEVLTWLDANIPHLQAALFLLSNLRRRFPEVMDSHMMWLSSIIQPTGTWKTGHGYGLHGKSVGNIVSKDKESANWLEHMTQPTETSQGPAITIPRTPDRPMASLTIDASGHFNRSGPEWQDLLDESDAEFQNLIHIHKTVGYHASLSGFLGIICRYEDAIRTIVSADQILVKRILRARLQPVETAPTFADQKMMKIEEFLEGFVLKDGQKLESSERHQIGAWFYEQVKRPDTEAFPGTWHAETILMCLSALSNSEEPYATTVHQTEDSINVLELPDPQVLNALKDMAAPLLVNKRCCPSCYLLLKHMEGSSNQKFLYGGVHSDWFGCSLPPWTPLPVFEAVYEIVDVHLKDRFERLVYVDRAARSGDSTGTHPAIPDQGPDSPVWYWGAMEERELQTPSTPPLGSRPAGDSQATSSQGAKDEDPAQSHSPLNPSTMFPSGYIPQQSSPIKRHASREVPHESSPSPKKK
ncbi:hypothetical protein CPAR01_04620 [Colletotrichum paranaense]|uniref:Uncharacterized protein n=1 Tax=Colletotrichum paranaense TaxID=1914294 RepID=A0ABQ9SWU5_9PEZI|nr:uncharacterized protein CPAR01_04620 [Colletotrichum paranaense]KAK1543987.1 hypothetical protein CPAR01_04620 [Colletotrichum paranaense]